MLDRPAAAQRKRDGREKSVSRPSHGPWPARMSIAGGLGPPDQGGEHRGHDCNRERRGGTSGGDPGGVSIGGRRRDLAQGPAQGQGLGAGPGPP